MVKRRCSSSHSAKPPMKSALATITPSAPPSGICELGLDRVGASHDAWDHPALDVLDVTVECEPGDRRQRREDAKEDRHRAHQRQHAVALGLLPEQLLELLELVRVLRRRRHAPGRSRRAGSRAPSVSFSGSVGPGANALIVSGEKSQGIRSSFAARPPAVLVDRSAAELEVLHVWRRRRRRRRR